MERQKSIVRAEAGLAPGEDGGDGKALPSGKRRARRAPLPGVTGCLSGATVTRSPVNVSDEMALDAKRNTLVRMMVRHLMDLPAWKDTLLKAARMCGTHDGTFIPASPICADCTMRERRVRSIVGMAARHFGDPRIQPGTKAFSFNPFTRTPGGHAVAPIAQNPGRKE